MLADDPLLHIIEIVIRKAVARVEMLIGHMMGRVRIAMVELIEIEMVESIIRSVINILLEMKEVSRIMLKIAMEKMLLGRFAE